MDKLNFNWFNKSFRPSPFTSSNQSLPHLPPPVAPFALGCEQRRSRVLAEEQALALCGSVCSARCFSQTAAFHSLALRITPPCVRLRLRSCLGTLWSLSGRSICPQFQHILHRIDASVFVCVRVCACVFLPAYYVKSVCVCVYCADLCMFRRRVAPGLRIYQKPF